MAKCWPMANLKNYKMTRVLLMRILEDTDGQRTRKKSCGKKGISQKGCSEKAVGKKGSGGKKSRSEKAGVPQDLR
jgi:hypothetical protein